MGFFGEELNYRFNSEDYSTILIALFVGIDQSNNATEIFDILKRREEKREVLEFYIIPISETVSTNLYEECCRLSCVIEDVDFWDEIIKGLSLKAEQKKGMPFDYVSFVEVIVNNNIGVFEKGTALKYKCILLKKELERLK